MAYKNTMREDEYSGFGKKLMGLMCESGYDTAPKLARKLYDSGVVKVKPRNGKYEDDDGTEQRKNAIGSVQKKIEKHLKSEICDIQGEFIIAYSRFFQCSADWLLGFTDVRTPNIEVRQICEKTGLSEAAVDGVRKIIGTDSDCIYFGYESESMIDILNNMFSKYEFINLIEEISHMNNTYKHFYTKKKKINRKPNSLLEIVDKRMESLGKRVQYEELDEEKEYVIREIIADMLKERDEKLKIRRYCVRERFEKLIDAMYPDINNKISELLK